MRSGVTRSSDGSIEDTGEWLRSLRTGTLHQAVALGRAAQSHPLTWVVDPAVIDAVRQLARGNPPRTLRTPAHRRRRTEPEPEPVAQRLRHGHLDGRQRPRPTRRPCGPPSSG